MKILHTADWHIGKILHKHSLQQEISLFFDWLLALIDKERVDLLLVAGDIFDLANPSAKDRKLYYQLLTNLNSRGIRVIITGGNHDSVGLLNAPEDVLRALNITVIGGATKNIEDEIIIFEDDQGNAKLVLAAVPFLRDKDLRNHRTDEQYKNRTEAIRAGIKNHYELIQEICSKKYPNLPLIGMGHLYAVGAEPSESERDIHVGNAAAVGAGIFRGYDYVALGHIHRPQIISKNDFIRYSGSPIALSFSEKKDQKSVVLIELENNKLSEPKVIPVPKSRELKKISGSFQEVKEKLDKYQPSFALPSFVELEINEDEFSAILLAHVDELKNSYLDHGQFNILKARTFFKTGTKNTADLFKAGESIEDLRPMEVFEKRLELENLESKKAELLKEAFQELLEQVVQSEDE